MRGVPTDLSVSATPHSQCFSEHAELGEGGLPEGGTAAINTYGHVTSVQ